MASSSIPKDNELSSFDVPETSRHSSGHTLYKIVLQITPKELAEDSYQLVYLKRYADIRKLYEVLQRYHQAIYRPGKFPDFPDKARFMERFDPAVVEERRVATKTFLNYILQHLYLRTHEAYISFLQNGDKVPLPNIEIATLQPEVLGKQAETPTDTTISMPSSANEPIVESKQDELLLTTAEEEQIEHVTERCAQILDDLNDLQFDQQQEIQKETEEFSLLNQQVDEAANLLSLPLSTTTATNHSS